MTASICFFCGTSAFKARRFVQGDTSEAGICGECIVWCTEILIGDLKPAATAPEPNFPRRPSASLENFLATAAWWTSCHVPPDVKPFAHDFLRTYEAAVREAANVPRHEAHETPNGDAVVEAAFDELMAPYRHESRRSYIGALFSAVLGISMRHAFRDHVALSRTRYGERLQGAEARS